MGVSLEAFFDKVEFHCGERLACISCNGVTVLNTSSFHVYTKVCHAKCMLKNQLLTLDESDCCACFNYIFFLENRGWSFNYLKQFVSIPKNYFYFNFYAHGERCRFS